MPLIEGHYTVDGFYEAIDDVIEEAWERFLNQASCHFYPELEALMDDLGLEPIEDDDVLPFWGSSSSSLFKSKWYTSYILAISQGVVYDYSSKLARFEVKKWASLQATSGDNWDSTMGPWVWGYTRR